MDIVDGDGSPRDGPGGFERYLNRLTLPHIASQTEHIRLAVESA
jgi:hypothetical protein